MCSEGGGKEESRFSDTNPNSEISHFRSGNFGYTHFISHLFLDSWRGRDFVGWEEQGPGPCGHYLNSPRSRFVDCSAKLWRSVIIEKPVKSSMNLNADSESK